MLGLVTQCNASLLEHYCCCLLVKDFDRVTFPTKWKLIRLAPSIDDLAGVRDVGEIYRVGGGGSGGGGRDSSGQTAGCATLIAGRGQPS